MTYVTPMAPPAMSAKVIHLKDLPHATFSNPHETVRQIAMYLQWLLHKRTATPNECILLPSLANLAAFFSSQHADVHSALQELRKQGYDYAMPGLYGHISLWHEEDTTRSPWQWVKRHVMR